MSMKSEDWGLLGRLMYKWFLRDLLIKATANTSNTFDDKALQQIDKMLK